MAFQSRHDCGGYEGKIIQSEDRTAPGTHYHISLHGLPKPIKRQTVPPPGGRDADNKSPDIDRIPYNGCEVLHSQ